MTDNGAPAPAAEGQTAVPMFATSDPVSDAVVAERGDACLEKDRLEWFVIFCVRVGDVSILKFVGRVPS